MNSEMNNRILVLTEPIVSIIVITFNSAKYVLETLESAKAQTYKNIELIVSDDCSTDNTIEICKEWIVANKSRFIRAELIRTVKNTGIPANCNRGIKYSVGEWVKLIAGDDILDKNCILLNMKFVAENPLVKIAISNVVKFKDGVENYSDGIETRPNLIDLISGKTDAKVQYNALLLSYFGNSAAIFISKSVYNEMLYDENIPFMEDYPFALCATKAGYSFNYFNAVTAYYRLSNYSVYGSKSNSLIFNDFYKKRYQFDLTYRHPNLTRNREKSEKFEYHRLKTIDYLGLNRNNVFCRILNGITFRLNPYRYLL